MRGRSVTRKKRMQYNRTLFADGTPVPLLADVIRRNERVMLDTAPEPLIDLMLQRGAMNERNDFAGANRIAQNYALRRGDRELAAYLNTDQFVLLSFDMMMRPVPYRKVNKRNARK